jgi:hypothetical protein
MSEVLGESLVTYKYTYSANGLSVITKTLAVDSNNLQSLLWHAVCNGTPLDVPTRGLVQDIRGRLRRTLPPITAVCYIKLKLRQR